MFCPIVYPDLLPGENLWETGEQHGIYLGPASWTAPWQIKRTDDWIEPQYGEGAGTGFDMVLLSGPGIDTARPKDKCEERMLNQYWEPEDLFPESRLAHQIVLTKAMDGMIVYVPPRLEDDIP